MPVVDTVPSLNQSILFHHRDVLRRVTRPQVFSTASWLPGVPPLPDPPAAWDWTKNGALQFPIDGNDQWGDCEVAATFHQVGSMTGCVGTEVVFTTAQAKKLYFALTGGQDTGLSTDVMMNSWTAGLGGLGHSILDQMAVNPNDALAMSLAGWLFGGIFFTLALPDGWIQAAAPGVIWDAGNGNPNKGHAILLTGKRSSGNWDVQTWAIGPPYIQMTQHGVGNVQPEATVVFSRDWFNDSGVAPNGYTYSALAALWIQLGGSHQLPPWTGPTPGPGPGPITPPPVNRLFGITIARDIPARHKVVFAPPVIWPAGHYDVVPSQVAGDVQATEAP